VAHVGYRDGRHAPGETDPAKAVAANHHLLLAHGRAVRALRAASPSPAQIGITLNLGVARPVSPAAADMASELEARMNGAYLDPLLRGAYPERLTAEFSPAKVPGLVHDGDFDVIGAPMDFLGVNFYAPVYVGIRPDGEPRRGEQLIAPDVVLVQPEGMPVTAMNWLVDSSSIYELMTRLRDVTDGLRDPGRHGRGLRAARLPAGPPGGAARRHRRRGEPARVFRLVADGQLRVGRGVRQAVRACVRGLRHAEADSQAQWRLLRARGEGQRAAAIVTASRALRRLPGPGGYRWSPTREDR